MPRRKKTDELLTVNQTARVFKISPESVYRALRLGRITAREKNPTKISRAEAAEWRASIIST
jgi:hypothetical protein